MWAIKAMEAFERGDEEAGKRWTLAHLEQRTCTRSPELVRMLGAGDYEGVVRMLEFILSTL